VLLKAFYANEEKTLMNVFLTAELLCSIATAAPPSQPAFQKSIARRAGQGRPEEAPRSGLAFSGTSMVLTFLSLRGVSGEQFDEATTSAREHFGRGNATGILIVVTQQISNLIRFAMTFH
jgi:hypothetical protein